MKTKFTSPSLASAAADSHLNEARPAGGFSARKFWRELQLNLAATPAGRIVLHLLCLACDGRVRWHARGLGRELAVLLSECPAWLAKTEGSGAAQTAGLAFGLEHQPATQTSL